jgi:uncharacterized iron-regulated membrane protein
LKKTTMKSTVSNLRLLPAVLALSAASWGTSAYAQTTATQPNPAAAPTAVSRTEDASKKAGDATNRVGDKAVNAVRNADGGKPGAAVARTGDKIGSKLPQTEAYKKKNKGQKATPIPEAG